MSSKIANILSLTADEAEELEKPAGKIKTLAGWLSESVEAAKDTPLFKLLGDAGEVAKEWSGTVKAVGKLIEKLTKETSPEVLGWLACTIAYRKAAEGAVSAYGRPATRIPYSGEIFSERLKGLRLEDPSLMQVFSLTSAAGASVLDGR
jgi:hypothetical protein